MTHRPRKGGLDCGLAPEWRHFCMMTGHLTGGHKTSRQSKTMCVRHIAKTPPGACLSSGQRQIGCADHCKCDVAQRIVAHRAPLIGWQVVQQHFGPTDEDHYHSEPLAMVSGRGMRSPGFSPD